MDITKKCIISTLLALIVFGLFLMMSFTKSKNNNDIVLEAKREINQKIDVTKKAITAQMYNTAKNGDFSKKNVIASAKKIQKEISATAKEIKNTIETTADQVEDVPREKIRNTISKAKSAIKQEMKKAYKAVKKKIIRLLRGKNTNDIVTEAKEIKDTTDQTCETIKDKINIAYNEIKESTEK